MEVCEVETAAEKTSGDDVRDDAKGVEEEPTPAASAPPFFEQVPRSVGEGAERGQNVDRSNGKNYPRLFAKTCARLESGSGSGDQDGGQHDDGTDVAAKKRRTRRGKPKHRKKPYSKELSYKQQLKQLRSRCIDRIAKTNRQPPPALYNTTQFLMEDHSDLPDLEQKLSEAASLEVPANQKPLAPPRTRDSSFSVDSDEDYFYSSPEDEQEFLSRDFATAYEAVHEERLSSLSKEELIEEYKYLEAKMDSLTKRRNKSIHQMDERDSENKNVSAVDSETAQKLKIYQQRIDHLIQQNEQLQRENEMLKRTEKRLRANGSESSVDSESDSDSSSNSNQSERSNQNECSLSSPATSPKHTYKSRLDNNIRTDKKSDSCDTSQSGSPRTSTTPTNFSNGLMNMNEIDSFPP